MLHVPSISERWRGVFVVATHVGKGFGTHQGQDVPRYKEAGPPFPAAMPSVPWEAAEGGGGGWVGDHCVELFALLGGKPGLGRLTDTVAEAGSDTEQPAVLGQVTVLSQPQFLHL